MPGIGAGLQQNGVPCAKVLSHPVFDLAKPHLLCAQDRRLPSIHGGGHNEVLVNVESNKASGLHAWSVHGVLP